MFVAGKMEKFMGGPTVSPHDGLYVSLNDAFIIGFNENCYRLIGKPPAVYLHYSREDHIIGIEPVHSFRMPAAFPVKAKTRHGWRINAAPFCKHYGIRVDTTQRFIRPDLSIDGKMLLLKLTETVTVTQLRRKKN